ncbi:MAG TPA: hypothetical protein VHA12_02115 [Candidatus Nanoarchaeia archaeon]|nr:hypothetical protein [Candidatus Nanoarchaeia archaeon]
MEKRAFNIILSFLAISALLVALILQVSALDASSLIEEKTGVNPEKLQDIPQTTQEIKETYLKQSWIDLIEKNKYLGPAHNFLLKISPVFLILFGENYSISLVLLLVMCLWFYVAMELTSLIGAFQVLNAWACTAIACGVSIILAQIGAYRSLVTLLGNLVYAKELWWMRLMIILALVVAGFIIHYLTKTFEKQIKLSKAAAKTRSVENEIETQKEFIKGLKEGSSIAK